MIAVHHIARDPHYPVYPIWCNGFISTMTAESLRYELFKGFSTRNVELRPGGKPLNLGFNKQGYSTVAAPHKRQIHT